MDVDKRARGYAADYVGGCRRHSYHEGVEEIDPTGHSKRGKTVLLECHRLYRRHKPRQYQHDSHRADGLPERWGSASRSG